MLKNVNSKREPNFFKGPGSDIPLTPEHGGPILCMDIKDNIAITGSTDHGLRVYNLVQGKQIKELYNKKYGHTEWVTCVTILSDNRVISGGMDSNICVWDASSVKCVTLQEHTGSISKLISDDNNVVLSSSYDTSVRIWDMNSVSCLGVLKGIHKNPVTEFQWQSSLCVTGGRDGNLSMWDINTEKCIFTQQMHGGQISNIKFHTDDMNTNLIITTGISDGLVNVMDMRTNTKVFSNKVHSGAINFVGTNQSNMLVTGSADKTIKLFDISNNFKQIGVMKTTDSVFCGDIYNSFIAVGCGDGNLVAYNLDTLECLYGFGCDSKGGIKCVKILPDKGKIVTAGDSGEGLQLLF